MYLAPLFWHANQERWAISPTLRCALLWWGRYLAAAPVRLVPVVPGPRERVILYTDATGGGALAWVADTPWGRWYAAVEAPAALGEWLVPRCTQVIPCFGVRSVSAGRVC